MRHLPIARVDRSLSTFRTPTHFTRTESHAHRKASSARRSRSSLIQRFRETLLAQNHKHIQAPSAHRSRCSLIQHSVPCKNAPWWLIWAPSVGKEGMNYPHPPPKYQPNRPAESWENPLYTLAGPPGGWLGCHLATIHQSFSQIGPQTSEQSAGTWPTNNSPSLYIEIYRICALILNVLRGLQS